MSKSNEIEKYMAVYRHEENASHFIPRFLDTKHQYISKYILVLPR